jgi:hypothetical protein
MGLWFRMMSWEWCGRTRSWNVLRYNNRILETLRKTTDKYVWKAGLETKNRTWDLPNTKQGAKHWSVTSDGLHAHHISLPFRSNIHTESVRKYPHTLLTETVVIPVMWSQHYVWWHRTSHPLRRNMKILLSYACSSICLYGLLSDMQNLWGRMPSIRFLQSIISRGKLHIRTI